MILRWKEKTYHLRATPQGWLGVDEKQHRVHLRRKAGRPQLFEVMPHSRRTRAMAKFYFIHRDGVFESC